MNKVKLNDLIKSGNLVIPMYIMKQYSKFNLTLDEFVLLIYLYNNNDSVYNPELIANNLNIPIENVLLGIDSLSSKGLINIDVKKTENGLLEESINLDNFYEKITLSLIDELNEQEESDDSIFSIIEKTFDRKLKPNEQEIVISWQKEYSDELIMEALNEASDNDSINIRYIDKILYDWKRQGIKSLDDIKNMKEAESKPIEVYNYNWLDDDSEV